jgi:arsenite-transporting ATPase
MIDKKSKNIFFLGKGGTGKTTLAALTATALAEDGERVVLFSMDPAHNLFDVFQVRTSKRKVKIQERFVIEEIDISYWIITYLKSIEEKIAKSYPYLTALSLEKHIKTIQFSPGLEEYALQYAYESVNKSYNNYTYRIFDMPPTALALRFFNLPTLTLLWLDRLIELRNKILEKKKIINSVHQEKSLKYDDKVLMQLHKMEKDYKNLISGFQDQQKTGIYIVLNEDELSISESSDIYEMMITNNFMVNGILVNKYQNVLTQHDITEKFDKLPHYIFPLAPSVLVGRKNLGNYINSELFKKYMSTLRAD